MYHANARILFRHFKVSIILISRHFSMTCSSLFFASFTSTGVIFLSQAGQTFQVDRYQSTHWKCIFSAIANALSERKSLNEKRHWFSWYVAFLYKSNRILTFWKGNDVSTCAINRKSFRVEFIKAAIHTHYCKKCSLTIQR